MRNIFLIVMSFIVVFPGAAHSGRTDSFGGHNNTKTGTYHYHNIGSLPPHVSNNKPIHEYLENRDVYVNQDCNVRSGPSIDFGKVAVLFRDVSVKLIEYNPEWSKIEFQYWDHLVTGWVATDLLSSYF